MAGLRIFETDPDAMPKPTYVRPEFAFEFKAGKQVAGSNGRLKPVSLEEWRVLTEDPKVGAAIHELMGGEKPTEFETTRDMNLGQDTTTSSVEVIIDGSPVMRNGRPGVKGIQDQMVLWGPRGPLHVCDGVTHIDTPGEEPGTPCGCPRFFSERKAKAAHGTGPSPDISIFFRLADDPELGLGKYVTRGWTFVKTLHEVLGGLESVGGEALCTLRLEVVEFTSERHGPVRYTKPVVEVQGSYNDAIAGER